jgi:hypothetical protein
MTVAAAGPLNVFVMAGLDPAIHLPKMMDTRVKSAYDYAGDTVALR